MLSCELKGRWSGVCGGGSICRSVVLFAVGVAPSRSARLRTLSCCFVVGQVCFTLALSLPDESRDGLVVLAGLSTLLVVRRVGRMPETKSSECSECENV